MKQNILKVYNFVKPYAAALLFSGGLTYNIIAFYFGLCFKENYVRSSFFLFFSLLLATISYCRLIEILRSRTYNNSLFINLTIALFFLCCFIVSCFLLGFSFNTMRIAMQFLVYSVPAMIWGVDIVVTKKMDFLISFERIGLLLIPAVVMYNTMSLLQINPFINYKTNLATDLGILNYMSLAYGITPFMASSVILFLSSDKSFGDFQWSTRFKYLRPLCIVLYLTVIVLSGTRGAIIGVIFFFIMVTIYHISAKRQILKTLLVSAAAGIIILFVMLVPNMLLGFVYSEGTHLYNNRLSSYLIGVWDGDFNDSNEDPVVSQNIDYLVSLPTVITEETFSSNQEYNNAKYLIGLIESRITLFTLAIKETIKQPLTGMGPLGFIAKYGMYPHNALLEFLSELGLLVGGFWATFVAVLFIRLFLRSLKDVFASHTFLLICSMSGLVLFSGSIWNFPVLYFAIGFSVTVLSTKGLVVAPKKEDVL